MWFHIRSGAFLAATLVVFVGIAATLGWMFTGYLASLAGFSAAIAAWHRLVTAIAVAGLGTIALLAVQIAAHTVTRRSSEADAAEIDRWTERWLHALDEGPLPEPPLPPLAGTALAGLRESVTGSTAGVLESFYERTGLMRSDVRTSLRGHGPPRAGAIERLAMMRHPATLEPLIGLACGRDDIMARTARRAVIRTLAAGELSAARNRDAGRRVLSDPRVGQGEALDLLLLLDREATPLLLDLLDPAAAWAPEARRAAIETVARARRLDLSEHLTPWVDDPDPETRAAALRAFRRHEYVPPGVEPAVLAAIGDDVPFVRTQAAGAAVALPWDQVRTPLWTALGDEDRWVRRTSAETLAAFGVEGRVLLHAAAAEHADRFARDMAAEVLAWS